MKAPARKNCFLMNTLLFCAFFLWSACGGGTAGKNDPGNTRADYDFRYQLTEPEVTFKLPLILEEISGLALSPDGRHLLAVQDEDGIVFFIDKHTGKVDKEVPFGKKGDYEAIEVVGEDIYVANSSSQIFRLRDYHSETPKVRRFDYFLTRDNDVEGLAYDEPNNRLLVACKAHPGKVPDPAFSKAIYAIDLSSMTMAAEPAYIIHLSDIQTFLDTHPAIRKLEKLIDLFTDEKSRFIFGPSGLAFHPITGHLYVLSSQGKLLVVLSPKGEILHIERLKKELHPQPEGICFDRDGTMYISNEGKGEGGTIHRFARREIGSR
jgi:uncharacterized protein YjiK